MHFFFVAFFFIIYRWLTPKAAVTLQSVLKAILPEVLENSQTDLSKKSVWFLKTLNIKSSNLEELWFSFTDI